MTDRQLREELGLSANGEAGEAGEADGRLFLHTDLGNAERLAAAEGADLRYVHGWQRWLVQDGTRWKPDETGEVVRRAKRAVRAMYHDADRGDGRGVDKDLARHALKSQARRSIDAMIALAQSEVPITPDELDRDPWLLNVENGTIDLRTGELREHRREDFLTKLAPVAYDPSGAAKAPTFEAFLERVLPNPSLRKFVQRAFGYAASGVVSEEVLVIFHGTGDNGKTTLINIILEALGDYAIQAARDLLLAKRGSHPTELTDLFGTRFVACTETDDGRRLAEALVKQLTGRERIRARGMRQDFWEFSPTHTTFLSTNHKPEVRGTDHAIWRRLKLVPFEVRIPDDEKDAELPEKLRAELPGILAWVVRGCLEYQRSGLGEPQEVKDATQSYRAEMDVLAAFIGDCCVVHADASTPATPLYKAYQEWCGDNGEASESQKKFGGRLRERGLESFTYTAGPHMDRKGWRGIGLRTDRPGPGVEKGDGPGGGRPPEDPPDDRPGAESRLDIGDRGEGPDEPDDTGPENNIAGSANTYAGVISKKGPGSSDRPVDGPEDGPDPGPAGALAACFADPPSWLRDQLELCREDPERLLKPTATAVAAKVLGSPHDWRRVEPVLREYIEREGEG